MSSEHRQYLMAGFEAGSRYILAQPPHAPRGRVGNELGRGIGSSLEFMEHRDYLPGDDLRRLDWNVYARTDRLAVKQYREEVCPHIDILVDCSRSMALPGTEKARATLGLLGLLCSAAEASGYSRAIWLAADGCRKVENGNSSPLAWPEIELESDVPLPECLHGMPPQWRTRALRFVISDLLYLGDPSVVARRKDEAHRPRADYDPRRVMSALAAGSAQTVILQVLAREDVEPPTHGNVRLEDSETGEQYEIYIDAAARRRYMENLQRHQQNWSLACREHGAMFTTLVAEKLVDDWALEDLLAGEYLRLK